MLAIESPASSPARHRQDSRFLLGVGGLSSVIAAFASHYPSLSVEGEAVKFGAGVLLHGKSSKLIRQLSGASSVQRQCMSAQSVCFHSR